MNTTSKPALPMSDHPHQAHPHQAADIIGSWAHAYFYGLDLTSRRALLARARRGEAITIPTTTVGDVILTGAGFLKAVAHD